MSLAAAAIGAGERVAWPDPLLRAAIGMLVGRTRRRLRLTDASAEFEFARLMAEYPIAINTREANEQHYEISPEFFALMLGPQRKYSCCYYEHAGVTLAEAEGRALAETAEHAALADGQHILELGCGWGSLSLWMARRYPAARIVAVSNSRSQRNFIAQRAQAEGLRNLTVVAADINSFTPPGQFDRVVSVEMFEHMSNWRELLRRIVSWLTPQGALFLDAADRADWIAQHFFSGGIMPSHGLIRRFGDLVAVERDWRWDGTHYRRTAEHWLENFDRNAEAIDAVLHGFYGADATLWHRRWRLFLHATAGLFGHSDGEEWGVSHYRLRAAR
jgi:cyclopropane-fatty-acyl-phospholipid synthase